MKYWLYRFSFVVFGLLVATLLHGLFELWLLELIFSNPDRFSETLWWQEWPALHAIGSGVLWVVGVLGGVWAGKKYWRKIYGKATNEG